MRRKVKMALEASGVVASVAAAASCSAYAVTKFLMRIALDREAPKGARKLYASSGSDQDFWDDVDSAAKQLSEKESETVQITAQDGTPLIGHWIPCEHPKRILIAMHGWRSTWYRDFGMIADFWAGHGCGVLYAEQRGQGSSGGACMGFGLAERYDCLDWAHWANDRFGTELPLYLCGVSMGATTVLMAAGLPLPENVRGIGADCGFTSPEAIWRHVTRDAFHVPYGVCRRLANRICREKTGFGAGDYSTVEALKHNRIPVMFAHGTGDTFVPVEMTYENYQACAAPKKLLIVPGAGHGMSYCVDKADYEATTLDFWRLCEQPAAHRGP